MKYVQYIPRNMHTIFALLCFVMVIHWLIFPYPSGLLHWHCGNLTIAPVPAKQPWWIWITNTSCEFIMNDCITTTKQSTTKPCAYFLGYTVHVYRSGTNNHMPNIWFKLVWIELLSSLSSLVIFKTSFLHRHAAIIVLPLTLVSPFLLFLSTSNDCPSASKATLMNMDNKYFMWIHYERLHNHNKAKHNKTVCIFLGIYCTCVPQRNQQPYAEYMI